MTLFNKRKNELGFECFDLINAQSCDRKCALKSPLSFHKNLPATGERT